MQPIRKTSLVFVFLLFVAWARAQELPNIIIIYTDDQGYHDLSCYGAGFKTPNIDKLAREGVRFTDFYVAQPVCSASRAALLTGCYPNRVGINGALMPTSTIALSHDEITLAEICKQKGYATGMIGKWHLGHTREFLPNQHGFDYYFGLPYSNDMWPMHPTDKTFPRLGLLRQDSVVRYLDSDQSMLTGLYTEEAVNFIKRHQKKPFFLYLAHSMPHVPLFVSSRFDGKSGKGLYADVISELDASVATVIATLKQLKLDHNTLVIFASDNGPWLSYGDHAGSAFPLREGKGTVLEGGVRVPCIMWWPGKIPAGKIQHQPAMTIDILPTLAKLLDTPLPDKIIDGKDIWPLIISKDGAVSPQPAYFFYYKTNDLESMRMGPWKLYFPHRYQSLNGRKGGTGGMPVPYDQIETGLVLYNLDTDVSEETNVSDEHPDVVKKMVELADDMRRRLGDRLTNTTGEENRAPGKIQ